VVTPRVPPPRTEIQEARINYHVPVSCLYGYHAYDVVVGLSGWVKESGVSESRAFEANLMRWNLNERYLIPSLVPEFHALLVQGPSIKSRY
jgi:hypothetical protein